MDRPRFRAFTLVELLVVILIICMLLALLMPAFASAWQMAQMTQCKTNLATLYKAQGLWSADHETPSTSLAGGWAGSIRPYLENRPEALKCPSCPKVGSGLTPDDHGGGTLPPGSDPKPEDNYPGPPIELKDVGVGVLNGNQLLYEISLDNNSHWTHYGLWPANTPMPGGLPFVAPTGTIPSSNGSVLIGSNIDNGPWPWTPAVIGGYPHSLLGGYDTDFNFQVEYKNGKPYKVTIGACDANADQYYTDFRVNHKPIWGGQKFRGTFAVGHWGETINLYEEAAKNGTLTPVTSVWTAWFSSTGVLGATNYGLSRGACLDTTGRIVSIPDPKLFFILDYPRTVVDFTKLNDNKVPDTAYWQQIFISPAPPPKDSNWTAPPGLEGYTWQDVQALRHFGKANVLFCDGHIESLGKDDLDPTNLLIKPLWWYGAQ